MKKVFIALISLFVRSEVLSQGMPIDSLADRFSKIFSPQLLSTLREALPVRYDEQRVWGLSIGDFSNDTLPDIAISLYDIDNTKREVTVCLLVNDNNKEFKNVFRKKYSYVETPIEVGLSTDGSVVTVIQKSEEDHWYQEGYTVYAGDVILVDNFETNKEEIPAANPKAKAMGHSQYHNYETLFTKENYFATKDLENMMDAKFFTFPAYSRLRSVYPGYGKDMTDTTKEFIVKGLDYRRDSKDLSIHRALAAFDDEFLYFSITVSDDQVYGGDEKFEANDRVSLCFDTWQGKNRFMLKTKKGGIPTFRTEPDSNMYSLTFSAPSVGIRTAKLTISSAATLSDVQKDAGKQIRSIFTRDTTNGIVTGYTLKVKIPFTFFGFESNIVTAYENRASELMFENSKDKNEKADEPAEELQFPYLGFTAVVHDVDNPAHPEEETIQATSKFNPDDPTSYGEIRLIPSGKFYGEVKPTYMKRLKEELLRAGY